MAGDWIKMRADLREDPAVFAMADALNIDELHVVGCLHAFWSWADKHAVDGRVDGATSRLVDKASGRKGFAQALADVKWIVIHEGGGIEMPNFERHNGETAKERSLKNKRQARWRDGKATGSPSTDTSTPASTLPSTDTSTREEKRREEQPLAVDTSFDTFWKAYPRKQNKPKARAAWKKLGHVNGLLPTILQAVEAQSRTEDWTKDGGQFIPHASSWINGHRWEDEAIAVTPAVASTPEWAR